MDLMFRCMVGLLKLLAWILTPMFWYRTRKLHRNVPKITNDILRHSATTLAKKIRQREITCLEVINAYIARIKEVNPIINAVVEERFSDAIKDAKVVDKTIANNEFSQDYIAKRYPLLGVPLTIKEACQLNGLSHCVGTKKRIGIKAKKDGEAVRKVREAGAIPLLVSNTPELSSAWETDNMVTGRTLNPYHTGYTAGGSSGGEGALLGSGASVIGIGSDVAGSIRLPAMFNGIFGHKPTPRTTSIDGHYPICKDPKFTDFFVIGPMTRYAEDLKLMMNVMSNEPNLLNLDEKVEMKNLKIFWMDDAEKSIVLNSVDEDIKSGLNMCLAHLKSCGCTIEDYKFNMKNTCEMSGTLLYKMDSIPNVLTDPSSGKDVKNLNIEILKSLFGISEFSLHALYFYFLQKHNIFVSRSKYDHYKEKARLLKNDFVEKLGKNGVFLCPTFPLSGLEHDKTLLLTTGTMYVTPFNSLGMPSTNVPLGINRKGLPIGIQVVSSPYQDRLCLAVAEELERKFGGWREP